MIEKERQTAPRSSPLIEVTRGHLVESIHSGFIAVVDANGDLIAGTGEIKTRTYLRSAAKPFLCVSVVSSGAADHFKFTPPELAVICGSHSGEAIHLEAVSAILEKIGLTEAALQCGIHPPFDEATAKELAEEKRAPRPLHNNCSGHHAGLLAYFRFCDYSIEEYLDFSDPINMQILKDVADFAEMPASEIVTAIDGCSAQTFGLGIEAMARSYAKLVARGGSELHSATVAAAERVVQAMIEHPEMVGGTKGRLDTDLMRVARGQIVSKGGAEGLQLLAVRPCARYPNGLGIAVKIEDGDNLRARAPVVIETLRQLGLLDDEQLSELSHYVNANIYNLQHCEVGEVRTCFKIT
jgi:L-asparaginase II